MAKRIYLKNNGLGGVAPNGFTVLGMTNYIPKKQIGAMITDLADGTGSGATGPTGPSGDIGLQGPTGSQGEIGPTGSQGEIGAPGANGTNGSQGPIGPQGVAGPVGPAGLYWQGSWSEFSTYDINFAVGYSGSSYFCVATVSSPTSSNPVIDTTSWALLSSQGSPGPQGPQGIQGVMGPPSFVAVSSTSSCSPISTVDFIAITAQNTSLFFSNPQSGFSQGQALMIRIKDDGTARGITYDTKYRAVGVNLPSTTVIGKTVYLGFLYNATEDKFDCIGISQQS